SAIASVAMPSLLVLLLFSSYGAAFKFLVFNPQFGNSHVNYMSRLSDALIDEGHEVVMVSPRTDLLVGSPKTRARVLEVPQAPKSADFQHRANSGKGALSTVWESADVFKQIREFYPLFQAWVDQCEVTLADRELMETLKKEHFDAGFTETWDSCGYGLFHQLGITKYATTNSLALLDGLFSVTQVPVNTAYIPSMMGGSAGDRMSFIDRVMNTLAYLRMDNFVEYNLDLYQALFGKSMSQAPNIRDLMRNSSLVFMNSDPVVDFPKLTSPRVIDIGGISVHGGHDELDEYWSSVLSHRNHTIFMSFGTFVKSHLMPAAYKETIRETAKKFPDVTFVWKYEKPEHNISAGIDNLVETTWAPQHDLLQDPRLTAFITHGGQGSITESAGAGVPLICIGVTADQLRNARQVERNGVGIMLNKDDLGSMGPLEKAIERVLKDKSYKNNAVTLAHMIADRPFSMKDVFVKNMEFMVKYGPHHRLQHYGSQLSFIQYYLIDVFAFLALLAFSTVFLALFSLKLVVEHISGFVVLKKVKSQ
ncbi:hypothetical protein PRIPAC_71821, partial [Pristionchus pacificus]